MSLELNLLGIKSNQLFLVSCWIQWKLFITVSRNAVKLCNIPMNICLVWMMHWNWKTFFHIKTSISDLSSWHHLMQRCKCKSAGNQVVEIVFFPDASYSSFLLSGHGHVFFLYAIHADCSTVTQVSQYNDIYSKIIT